MATFKPTRPRRVSQATESARQLRFMLDSIDASALLDRLAEYRPTGRKGYPLKAL